MGLTNEEFAALYAKARKDGTATILLQDGTYEFTVADRVDFGFNRMSQRGNMVYYCYGMLKSATVEEFNYLKQGLPFPQRFWEKMAAGQTYRVTVRNAYVNYVVI